MNKEYKIKLDLNKKLYNKKMTFNQFDENVNDFYIEVTKNNEVVKDLDKSIVTLVAIKPNNTVDAQFIEVKEGQIYADLKPSMCDLVGNYQAKAMIVLEGEIVTTDTINYSVNEDKIISKLNEDVVSDERFTLFTDALARLSTIEISEEQRVINEAERILSEENRKIEEAKRVSNENTRKANEVTRQNVFSTKITELDQAKADMTNTIANKLEDIDDILSECVTETELNQKGYSTFDGDYNSLTNKPNIPSVEGLATEDFVRNEIANAQLGSGDTGLQGIAVGYIDVNNDNSIGITGLPQGTYTLRYKNCNSIMSNYDVIGEVEV